MKKLISIILFSLALFLGCHWYSEAVVGVSDAVELTDSDADNRSHELADRLSSPDDETPLSDGMLQNTDPLARLLTSIEQHRQRMPRGRNRIVEAFDGADSHDYDSLSNRNQNINLKLQEGQRCESAPFQSHVSSTYYVYALRRLLC